MSVSGMFAVPLTPILLTMRSWQTSECSGLILWRGPLVAAPPRCVHLRLNWFAGFVCFAVHGNFQQLAQRVRSPDSFPHFRFLFSDFFLCFWRPEKEFGVKIGDAFTQNFPHAFAIPPPAPRIIFRAGRGDDADGGFTAERRLEQQPRPARMDVLRQHIKTFHRHTVRLEIFAQSQRRTIGAITARDMRRHHLHQIGRNAGLL